MLVFSRQRDETIMIGHDIELTIVDIRGDKVRIGIKAPLDISVHRKEVYDAIMRENEEAIRCGAISPPFIRDGDPKLKPGESKVARRRRLATARSAVKSKTSKVTATSAS